MNYYFLEYTDEKEAISDLTEKGIISDKEEFVSPMDVHTLGVVVEYDSNDEETRKEVSRTGYLVNVWGYSSYDFGMCAKHPKTPYCIPAGYTRPEEETELIAQ
jgi:hypothetical protein